MKGDWLVSLLRWTLHLHMSWMFLIIAVWGNESLHPHPALDQLFTLAQRHHQIFAQGHWQGEIASIQVQALYQDNFPQFTWSGNYDFPQSTFARRSANDSGDWWSSLQMQQVVFNRGREWQNGKMAQLLPRLASSQQSFAVNQHYGKIVNAFFPWITASWQAQLLAAQLKLMAKRVHFLQARSSIGRAKETDYLAVLVLEKKWQAKLAQLESLVADYWQELKVVVGSDLGTLPQVGLGEWDFRPFQRPRSQWRERFEQRPQMQLYQHQREKVQLEIALAKTSYYPLVRLEGNYYLHKKTSGRSDDWDLGISLSLPLYDFGAIANSLAEKKVQLLLLESTQNQGNQDQWLRYQAQEEAFSQLQQQISRHQEIWSLAQRIYRQLQLDADKGLATTFELNAALEELLEAEQDLNQAQFSLAQKWYQLGLAVGEWGEGR